MSVASRLLLILLFVAITPVVLSVVTALREHRDALDEALAELHQKTADSGAATADASVAGTRRTVAALVRNIPWGTLSDSERRGAQRLIFEQLDDLVVVAMLDERGEGIGAAVYATGDQVDDRHPAASIELLTAFGRSVPLERARTQGFAIGPHVSDPRASMVVPLAFAVAGTAEARWALAVGLSLRGVCRELVDASPRGVTTRLVDGAGQALCPNTTASSGGDVLSASAPSSMGWRVIVEQPVAQALASSRNIRDQAVFWVAIGVIAAILAGLVFTQSIRRPLRSLTAGADAVAAGKLDHRVPVAGRDEFGTLASSFNRMASEIERQNAEIRTWNEELQQRVDERTRELKDAQEQLLQSRKLGAVAALGAGVAHEINNPLASVIGMTQVVLATTGDGPARAPLLTIEREAHRIRDIVSKMKRLADDSALGTAPIDVTSPVEHALSSLVDRLTSERIEVERDYAAGLPMVQGNAGELAQAFTQLIDNAVKAMAPTGGRLRLGARSIDDELVEVTVTDSGKGIPRELHDKIFEPFFTTKDDWHGQGLGLAIAFRIIEVHLGRIRVASSPGAGTTMTVTLPAARQGSHLA